MLYSVLSHHLLRSYLLERVYDLHSSLQVGSGECFDHETSAHHQSIIPGKVSNPSSILADPLGLHKSTMACLSFLFLFLLQSFLYISIVHRNCTKCAYFPIPPPPPWVQRISRMYLHSNNRPRKSRCQAKKVLLDAEFLFLFSFVIMLHSTTWHWCRLSRFLCPA